MLTINILKAELKKAFFGETVNFSQELTVDTESAENLDIVLLKIMLENYEPNKKKEVA